MQSLNLGILAHVDAGKTSLTERLLFAAGVIDTIGRVDHGDTQTDTLALERERGITIKSAVVSFEIGGVTVNLVDTPGHPDFIAEVDRALGLLDGAVLVVSAVEGVQAQTRVLMRALRRLRIPTLIFVNKADRMGADLSRVVEAIVDKLSPDVVVMSAVEQLGTRDVKVVPFGRDDEEFVDEMIAAIAAHDDHMLERYVNGTADVDYDDARARLARCTRAAVVHPIFFGSAITGAGVAELIEGVVELLPVSDRRVDGPLAGVVFKIERGASGERSPIVHLVSGAIRVRDRVRVGDVLRHVTRLAVFERGAVNATDAVHGGQFAKLGGLVPVRIGDPIGEATDDRAQHFSPPPFEAVVVASNDADRHPLRAALEQLADEDPLINLRQDVLTGDLSISLYGEVQRDVIGETLRRDFGIDVEFGETVTVCIERLSGTGEAVEMMLGGRSPRRPLLAGVGLRVDAAPAGSGLTFSAGIELGRLPVAFVTAVHETVVATLRQGLYGWEIPDCAVTMTASGYWPRQSHAHATFDKNMSSIASDFRLLTPLVLMAAIRQAGTTVHEPFHHFYLEAPGASLGVLTRTLAGLQAVLEPPEPSGSAFVLRGTIAASHLQALRQRLPGLTGGDGFVETAFDSYQPIRGTTRARGRSDDALDRDRYIRSLAGRA